MRMGPGKMPNFSNNKNVGLKPLGFLMGFLKPYVVVVIIALVCAFLGAIGSLIGPKKLEELTNIISASLYGLPMDFNAITNIAVFLLVVYIIAAILNYVQGFIMSTVTQRVTKKLRTKISNKINKIPLRYFDNTQYGDVLSRVTNDVDTIGQTMNNSVASFVSAITLFLGSLIMMLITNWIMALSAVVATAIGFLIMLFIMKKSQKYFVMQQKALEHLMGILKRFTRGTQLLKHIMPNSKLKNSLTK